MITRAQRAAYLDQLKSGRKRLVIAGRSCLNEADLDFALSHMPHNAELPEIAKIDLADKINAVEPNPDPAGEQTDGAPTFEQWLEAGYKPENYPPDGYTAKDSPGWTEYCESLKPAVAKTAEVEGPKSFNDLKKELADIGGKFTVGMNRQAVEDAIAAIQE